jgi:hypothetical protein
MPTLTKYASSLYQYMPILTNQPDKTPQFFADLNNTECKLYVKYEIIYMTEKCHKCPETCVFVDNGMHCLCHFIVLTVSNKI